MNDVVDHGQDDRRGDRRRSSRAPARRPPGARPRRGRPAIGATRGSRRRDGRRRPSRRPRRGTAARPAPDGRQGSLAQVGRRQLADGAPDQRRRRARGGRARPCRPGSRRGARPRPGPSRVSPAISRSRPPGSTAASSSCSRVVVVIHGVLSILAGRHRHVRPVRATGPNSPPSASRRRSSARRVRVLTVPSGQSSRSAISVCDSSSW